MSDSQNSKHWQQFLFAFIVQLILPLTPVLCEFIFTGTLSPKTLAIAAAMYTISIGVSTNHLAILGLSIFVAIVSSAIFGSLVSGNPSPPNFPVTEATITAIALFMITHGIERFRRHVLQKEIFLELS